jgi:hypothetical protein
MSKYNEFVSYINVVREVGVAIHTFAAILFSLFYETSGNGFNELSAASITLRSMVRIVFTRVRPSRLVIYITLKLSRVSGSKSNSLGARP